MMRGPGIHLAPKPQAPTLWHMWHNFAGYPTREESNMKLGLKTRTPLLVASALLAASAVTGFAPAAKACGGFWCSQAAPVNQTAEKIIFVDNADDTTTCVVQISYEGPSEHFAWLLPVAGVPTLDVSSNIAFDRLSQATQPQYVLERHVEGECNPDYGYAVEGDCANCALPTANLADGGASSVQLLAQGSVGPYDYSVISVDRTLTNPADAAINWLVANGYDVTADSAPVLGPYLADGLNIVAMKLQKGTETGQIRPVVITYPGDKPSIPIRPTAVASTDDMGILVWVLAQDQAVPQNYRSLILNEALINWWNPYSNYDQVVTAAANEAGGQGFVTELAGSSDPFNKTVYGDYEAQGWAQIQQQSYQDPIDLLWAANGYFRGWDGWKEAIEQSVTLPAGVTIDDFAQNPDAYRGIAVVDEALFRELLDTTVVQPVMHTQEIINSRPYMTRLYSTMSPDEMTLDPVFTFNPDLAPVSNVHTAQLYLQCDPSLYEYEAPWRIVLPQGGTLYGTGQYTTWPLTLDGTMPANYKIVQLSETGSGDVIENNATPIATEIVQSGGTYTPPTLSSPPASDGMPIGGNYEPVVLPENSSASAEGGGCGCAVPGERSSRRAAVGAFALGVALGIRRRRARA